jgi:hypothetical protein
LNCSLDFVNVDGLNVPSLAISTIAVDNNIDYLIKQLNIRERIGPDKGGKWKIHFIQPKN